MEGGLMITHKETGMKLYRHFEAYLENSGENTFIELSHKQKSFSTEPLLVQREGKIGTEGEETEKEFISIPRVIDAAYKIIEQKLKQGYKQIRKKGNIGDSSSLEEALKTAIKTDDIELAKAALKKGIDLNKAEKAEDHPLYLALYYGNETMANLLLANGAKLDNDVIFEESVYGGVLPIVQGLIAKGLVDPKKEFSTGYSYLLLALVRGHIELSRYLFTLSDQEEPHKMFWYAAKGGVRWAVEYGVENGGRINHQNRKGKSALSFSASNGCLDIVTYLIEKGANINNNVNAINEIPLLQAMRNGHMEIAEYLVKSGADVNVNDDLKTPLHEAAYHHSIDFIQLLLENGADINMYTRRRYNEKNTPLMCAQRRHRLDVMKFLLKNGADIERSFDGRTALFLACTEARPSYIIKYLIEQGANVQIRFKGATILDYVIVDREMSEEERIEIVEILIEQGLALEKVSIDRVKEERVKALIKTSGAYKEIG